MLGCLVGDSSGCSCLGDAVVGRLALRAWDGRLPVVGCGAVDKLLSIAKSKGDVASVQGDAAGRVLMLPFAVIAPLHCGRVRRYMP